MIPYFVVLASVLLIGFFYKNTKSTLFLVIIVTILALFVGLRSTEVGTDTEGYANTFLESGMFKTAEIAAKSRSTEGGWNILNWWLYRINPHYWFFFTVVGFVTSSCAVYLIKKESPVPILSLFLYITLGFYLFGFAGMRQSFAIAIYGLAIPFLLKHDFKRYALIVIIGAMFHRTILIGLPLYFVFRLKYSVKSVVLLIGGSILIASIIPQLMALSMSIGERYSIYSEVQGGGELFAVFYTLMAFFFWTQRSKIVESRRARYDILMMMLICGAIIYLIVTIAGLYGEVTRFAMYYQLSIIFLWAELYKYRRNKLNPVFWGIAIVTHLVYFYIYLDKIGHTVPYVLNSSFN